MAFDLPGFGDTHIVNSGIMPTLDWLTGEIGRHARSRYLLVGHSMGGKFATLLAARAAAGAPELAGLGGVVLLAASPPAPEPMDEARRAEMIGWFAEGSPSDTDAGRFVGANIAASLSPSASAQAIDDVLRTSPEAWKDWLTVGARENWSDRVGQLDVPATLVAGAEDGDLGERNQRRLNLPHYANARVLSVPNAAHLLPYEQPEAVASLIREAAHIHCG